MEALMLRKIKNAAVLNELTAYYKNKRSGNYDEVVIQKTIILEKQEFINFCNDFFADQKFIEENQFSMWCDKDGVYHVIKVTCDGAKKAVLVESEGYPYARYTAIINEKE